TVLLSTHIMQEVESMCNRVIIINHGKIVADDNIAALQQQSKHELTIVVEFKNEVKESILKNIEGVKVVKQKGKKYLLKCSADVREQVSTISSQQGWVLLSMSLEEDSLESVFQKLTNK
ncbi:MAG: gliding motility-associated ABC transporter ATP-binding subunit GldA, partial [Bacteroidia bacterium]